MNTITPERLRPMTDTERAAADLFNELIQGGKTVEEAMAEICELTKLPRAQIAAAVELQGKFGALLDEVADKPKQPGTAASVNGKSTAKPKPTPAGAGAQPTASDIDELITAAENSPQPRARELAAEIRRALAAIRQIIADDEKVRVLTVSIGVLRRQLADDEAELAKLLGPHATPVTPEEPADEAQRDDSAGTATGSGRDPLQYSEDVRSWAIEEGWQVASSGRIAVAVVNAYRKTHPGT